MAYQRCAKSVLDNIGDPNITFDENGVSNYYSTAEAKYSNFVFSDSEATDRQEKIAEDIRKAGKGREYDCIIGLSGGVDSSYLAAWAKKYDLRPLAVHFDNGWNSEIAVRNIEKIVEKLDIDLYTYVVDWEEFVDIQRSFFKASVVDVEMITDNSHKAVSVKIAKKYKIPYNLHGGNFRTENMGPSTWSWNKQDIRNLKDIQKKFGTRNLKSYKYISDFRWELLSRTRLGLKVAKPLNNMNYRKDEAMKELQRDLDWQYYGGKHYESIFTKFYQAYYLPQKFNIDKRKVHLSSLILNQEITREEAIAELEKTLYDSADLKREKAYVLRKLGFTESEWEVIMKAPPRAHTYYASNARTRGIIAAFYRKLKSIL